MPQLFTVDAAGAYLPACDREVVDAALDITRAGVCRGAVMESPRAVKDYIALALAKREAEAFVVVFLDAQNRLLDTREMFHGTATQAAIYPREIVKAGLKLNASAVILAHNHPSGSTEPSRADIHLTDTLKKALMLVDIHVLDHIVTGGGHCVSMAERGLI